MTWLAVHWFLPDISYFSYVIAALNSLIIILQLLKTYWVIKL